MGRLYGINLAVSQRFFACFFTGLVFLCDFGFAVLGFTVGATFLGFAGVTRAAAFFTACFFTAGLWAGFAVLFPA